MSPSAAARSLGGHRRPPGGGGGGGTGGANWDWDATVATVDPNSAAKIAAFMNYGGPFSTFFIEVARADVNAHDSSCYTVSGASARGSMDNTIWVPNSAQGGLSNDQHLWIWDHVTHRWHDFDQAVFSGGRLSSWGFGMSMPEGVINVGGKNTGKAEQGATAAGFPLAQGTISPQDIINGVVNHALAITATDLGPKPNPYPATSWSAGYTSPNVGTASIASNLPLGTWLRLPASATLPGGATLIEQIIFTALKQYGCFIRDRGTSCNFHGQDLGGQGSSIPTWTSAGVALSSGGTIHIGNIPFSQLQVLLPPPYVGGDPGQTYPPQ
jgi:hypothetical protein